MSPALLLPVGLLALLALAMPVVIHIARKTESRTIDFAALRWLEQKAKPRRRLQIDERVLLASRLIFLALLALWLARPVVFGLEDDRPVVGVVPGLGADAIGETPESARLVWLTPGFPTMAQPATAGAAGVVSLVRQLDAETPPGAPLTIVVPGVMNDVDAERPVLSRRVVWRTAETGTPTRGAPTDRPPALSVRASADHQGGVRYLRAAATAWADADAEPRFQSGDVSQALPGRGQRLIWLAAGPVPDRVVAWVRNGGTALLSSDARLAADGEANVVWRDEAGAPLAEARRLGSGRLIQLTRSLEPSSLPQLLEPEFPDTLRDLIAPPPAPARALAADHAPLTAAAAYDQPPLELRPWLALILALVFAGERWLATRRERAPAP